MIGLNGGQALSVGIRPWGCYSLRRSALLRRSGQRYGSRASAPQSYKQLAHRS